MENWRDVPGRDGYIVSDQGRVAKLMKTTPGPNGYVQMSAPRPDGKRYRDYLHDWVLQAFHGPRPAGLVGRHLNDVAIDNRAENLVWGTRAQNNHDMYRNGRKTLKTHCQRGHELSGDNLAPGRRCRACRRERARA